MTHARRYWTLMGPRAFALQLANPVVHRALGLAGRLPQILHRYVPAVPEHGAINLHGSLLRSTAACSRRSGCSPTVKPTRA